MASKRLIESGTAWGGTCKATPTLKLNLFELIWPMYDQPPSSSLISSKKVEDRIPDGYFDGLVKQKLNSASWLVAGWLTSSLQKEINADCKEVTKASG
ncbi:hypothetical protein PIB30_023566 [Stylosanthes scabra]|uniref:Uncharacterized protein n=1 Tax=Stylosanthes scabra TaxID=79078 RepID=A0ABU6X965_9FABA|nr:hypothetical protein [Stylosanthes scabra]